jgi:hypothetical protein
MEAFITGKRSPDKYGRHSTPLLPGVLRASISLMWVVVDAAAGAFTITVFVTMRLVTTIPREHGRNPVMHVARIKERHTIDNATADAIACASRP